MRYFYDCEFIEDGHTIELISIGIVASDGREYYAVNADVSQDRIIQHSWLRENVWPSLPTIPYPKHRYAFGHVEQPSLGRLDLRDPDVRPRATIATEVRDFLLAPGPETPIELWAYYGAYDHVALAQLFGPMVKLPAGLPMFTRDIMQAADGVPTGLPEQESGLHNALEDARHVKVMWEYLHPAVTA